MWSDQSKAIKKAKKKAIKNRKEGDIKGNETDKADCEILAIL